jgi:hypothetical protein
MKNSKNPKIEFNSTTVGLKVLKKELNKTKILEKIDKLCPKLSGYSVSKIFTASIFKNILNVPTYTQTQEEFMETPEFECLANRTTLGRNIQRLGKLENYNCILLTLVIFIITTFKILSHNIRIVIDGTTIEVSKKSKYEGVDWVWDNAQGKNVWGYEVTIIALTFEGIYIPVYFEIGEMKKSKILKILIELKTIFNTNKILFDGGYASDSFYEKLTENGFIFYTKVAKNWLFNNGLTENIETIKNKVVFSKNEKYYTIKAFREKKGKTTDVSYSLCFKKNDPRVILTNDLSENVAEKAFNEFFKRWDIETCNDELKDNFCFEKLPIRNLDGIIGYLLSCFVAMILMVLIKIKFKDKLGNLFNKGFKKIIRFIILVKAKWKSWKKLDKLLFRVDFKFKWFYEHYGLA